MCQALSTIAQLAAGDGADPLTVPWGQLRHAHTAAIRAALAERFAPATCNKMLAALRGTLKAAWRLGQMNAEDYAAAADVPPVRGTRAPKGRALAHTELGELLKVCSSDAGPAGRRDAALIAVAAGCGLRRAELAALDLVDYDALTGAITVRAGKGNKYRKVFLPPDAEEQLQAWIKGRPAGPLFVPISKAGRPLSRRLSAPAVAVIFKARAAQAGVPNFSPHDMRRTMISALLAAGEDLATVQKMAGHADIKTTAGYDRRGEDAQRAAARRLRLG